MADYFISDLHLSDQTPDLLQALRRFVDDKKDDISTLFILGDLFEFWIGDDYQTDCSRDCASILRQLPDVRFVAGNRDFLLGERYAQEAGGMQILPEQFLMNICGHNAYVTHGDQLCVDDVEYQKARIMLRNPQWQKQFLSLPIAERFAQATEARKSSGGHVSQASEEIMDVNKVAVRQCMQEQNASIMLHGHTHKPALHDLGDGLKRLVLGDWGSHGWFFKVEPDHASLVSFSIDEKAQEDVLATIS